MPRASILIVEDDPIVLMTSAQVLRDAGLAVIEAISADAAAELLLAVGDEIAVVFSDVEMAGALDGLALARLVAERWPDIAVVLTSGRVHAGTAGSTCAHFVGKPYDAEQVSTLLADFMAA